MRRSASRVVSSVLLALVTISCSDSPTSLNRAPIRIALAPQFSAKTLAIYKSLSAFAVTLDNVHVVVRLEATGSALGPVLKDTTIAFPATADSVTIDLDIDIQGTQQDVVATVELLQGDVAYFSGTQDFVAKQGATAASPEPVAMKYVGPGATAAVIVITPQQATLAPSATLPFTTRVSDATDQTVTGLPLTWSTSDSTIATVSQTGVVTSTGKLGLVTLMAKGLNSVVGQAVVNVQPVAKLAVSAGDNQTGLAGATLPTKFQVQALDANGNRVIGATVNFAAVSGGGVSPASATTDINGFASTTLTLGPAVGTSAFTATIAGSPNVTVRIAASVAAAAAAALGILGGNNQVDTVLATFANPLSVKVTDSFGNPVPQQAIDFQVTSALALLVGVPGTAPQALVHTSTDNTGTAQVTLVAGPKAGTVNVIATVPQTTIAPATFSVTLRPGLPQQLMVIKQPSATAQATITLGTQPAVQVADLYGNAVALAGRSIQVTPSVDCALSACGRVVPTPGTSTSLNRSRLRPTTAPTTSRLSVPTAIAKTQSVSDTFPRGLGGTTQVRTDGNGIAAFTNLSLNLSAGAWVLEFFDANQSLAAGVSKDIALSPGPIQSIVALGVNDTSFVGLTVDTLFPSVRVIDKVGNGIPGVPVAWTVPGNLSKLDSTSTTTDANGVAAAGRWVMSFAAGGTFVIQATPNPSNIENSPLSLYAFLTVIGRVVPPTVPSTPP